MKEKTCEVCGCTYAARGTASRYCLPCAKERARIASRTGSYAHKLRNGMINKPGVGSGGNQDGSNNHQYKHGLYTSFYTEGKQMLLDIGHCERCHKDLTEAKSSEWCVHHRDHDRTHNVRSNYELLCKRCHQLEHNCQDNLPQLKRATTIP